jgi:PAS domain S-box-containing protein/putative nucleotidyltransferase with HDIG domain
MIEKFIQQTPSQSELRYRRLFETAQDGILILDFNTGVIKDANPFIVNLIGYSRDELVGKELWEIGAIVDKSAALTSFTLLKDKGYVRYEDLPLRNKDGRILSVEFVSNAYNVNEERVIQCNIRDISDRKQLEVERLAYQHSVNVSMHETIEALIMMLNMRDPYTVGHQRRVSNLSVAIAAKMNIPFHAIEGVRLAALLHDIGEISIPVEILTKPIPLTNEETQILRNHVQVGYDILKPIHFPWNISQAILQHHERLDGSGYPNSLKDEMICLEAKIIMVADAIDEMTSNHPYKSGMGLDEALEVIDSQRGTLFDEAVVSACLKVFKEDGYTFPSYI